MGNDSSSDVGGVHAASVLQLASSNTHSPPFMLRSSGNGIERAGSEGMCLTVLSVNTLRVFL